MLAVRNVAPVWLLDFAASGAQDDGLLDGWPTMAPALLFHPASSLYLDGGVLNIGVVRDVTLVGTNDFLVFNETMEAVAFRGLESLYLEMSICPDGSTRLPVEIHPCPQGS